MRGIVYNRGISKNAPQELISLNGQDWVTWEQLQNPPPNKTIQANTGAWLPYIDFSRLVQKTTTATFKKPDPKLAKIKRLIEKAKLKRAIEAMKAYCIEKGDKEGEDSVLTLQARWNEIKTTNQKGEFTTGEYSAEKNKISNSLLVFVNSNEEED